MRIPELLTMSAFTKTVDYIGVRQAMTEMEITFMATFSFVINVQRQWVHQNVKKMRHRYTYTASKTF